MAKTKNRYSPQAYESLAQWLVLGRRPMAGAENLNVFDVFDQAAFTDLVRRALQTAWETIPAMGDQIAPTVPVYDRVIEREIAEVASIGLANFRAPDATPKIFNPRITYTQEVTELALIDEMSTIREDHYLRLTSPTPAIRARAGVDMVTRGKILQIRNEVRTEWWRWQVFTGNNITVPYTSNQSLQITYNYLSQNKPTAAVPWTDPANSTPISDLRAWQTLIANSVGVYASRIHMNTNTWSTLQRSSQARGLLTPTDRNTFLPTKADVESLLLGAPENAPGNGRVADPPTIILTDAGFRDTSAAYNRGQGAITKYLQDGQVLLTTAYIFEGEPIADVADGQVLVSESFNNLVPKQGMQSEIIVDHATHERYLRQSSARFVRLRRPGCFAIGKAY